MAFTQDWLADLTTYLLADATVVAQVSARGYRVEMPSGEIANQPRKAFVIRHAGGPGSGPGVDDYLDVGTERMDVFHYGANFAEAHTVRRAVHTALKSINRLIQGTTLIYWATPSGPVDVRFTEPDWPATIETWLVFAAEVAVT